MNPGALAAELGVFLGLGAAFPIARFLAAQRAHPTPFSSPTTDVRQPMRMSEVREGDRVALRRVADSIEHFGYSMDTAVSRAAALKHAGESETD